jgi:hypothetical protein
MAANHTQTLRERLDFIRTEGLGTPRYREFEDSPYALVVRASMPFEVWTGVFYAWMSLKGHLQGLHGWDRTELFANRWEDTVTATFVTVWDNAEAMAQWLDVGYPVPELLETMGVDPADMEFQLMRDFS